jgi:hypothetical protein
MSAPFEADLDPNEGHPRMRMTFPNGWSVSVVMRSPVKRSKCDFRLASVAACPTGRWGQGKTELLEHEAFPVEVARLIYEVASREEVV